MNNKIVNNIIELIGNTPLIRLNNISGDDDAEILAKLESSNPGGSVKDRPCLEMINAAENKGLIDKDTTIIEPTTGNTGIGLAMICAVKGYKCILTMPEDLSLERIYLLRSYGADVVLTSAKAGVQGSIKKAEELHKKIKNSFIPLQFKSQANPQAHRKSTAIEIIDACDGILDAFVAGVGTGGTITGVGEVLKENIEGVQVIAVEPKRSAVLSGGKPSNHKIQGIGAGFVPEILNQDILDGIELVDDQEAFDMSRWLGSQEGLCVGISAGANVVAAKRMAKKLGKGKRVVTILCDTGERYFSMEQFFEA